MDVIGAVVASSLVGLDALTDPPATIVKALGDVILSSAHTVTVKLQACATLGLLASALPESSKVTLDSRVAGLLLTGNHPAAPWVGWMITARMATCMVADKMTNSFQPEDVSVVLASELE